jgi:hypothetical protein
MNNTKTIKIGLYLFSGIFIISLMIVIQFIFGHYVYVFDKLNVVSIKIEDGKYSETQINECNAILVKFHYIKSYTCNPFPFLSEFIYFREASFPSVKDIHVTGYDKDNNIYDITKNLKNHINIDNFHEVLQFFHTFYDSTNYFSDLTLAQNNYSLDSIYKILGYPNILSNLNGYKVVTDNTLQIEGISSPYSYLGNIQTTIIALNGTSIFFDNNRPQEILYFIDIPDKISLKDICIELTLAYSTDKNIYHYPFYWLSKK